MKNDITAVFPNVMRLRTISPVALVLICSVSPAQLTSSPPSSDFLSFSTRGHREARGIDFTIAYPKGWRASESTAPNVVQSFKSVSGAKGEQLTVKVNAEFVEHIPLELRGQSETAETFMDNMKNDDEILSMMYPKPAVIFSRKRVKLDGEEAVQLQIQTKQSALGHTWDLFLYETMVYHDGILITFRFGFWDAQDQSSFNVRRKFQQRLPFYDGLLQAAVLPAQKQSPPPEVSSTVTRQPTGWSEVLVPEVCSFLIPPNMEVRSGEYKQFHDRLATALSNVYEIEPNLDRLTIQPKGLNRFDDNRPDTYARIMFETVQGLPGEFSKMDESLNPTVAELKELSDSYRAQTEQSAHVTVLNWYPAAVRHLNGVDALELRFRREGKASPVFVSTYLVNDFNKGYMLTMSYRESEKDTWEPLFRKVLQSVHFTKSPRQSSSSGAP